jgi:Cu/Zn superoxide dismutase
VTATFSNANAAVRFATPLCRPHRGAPPVPLLACAGSRHQSQCSLGRILSVYLISRTLGVHLRHNLASHTPQAATARGTVTVTQVETGPAVVDVDLFGLDKGPNPWHVHEFPVTNDDCGTTSTGGHYNPPGHPTQGELSMNLGDLANPSMSEQYVTDTLTLFGPDSIVGRSIVIHEAGTGTPRWACASLSMPKTVTATFSGASPAAGPVTGSVTFTQMAEGGDVEVLVELDGELTHLLVVTS